MSAPTGNSVKVKQMNRVAVLSALLKDTTITISQLADETNLTPVTIASILTELELEGFIHELGYAESNGGRKPRLYGINGSARVFWGVDIQVERIVSVIMGLNGDILASRVSPFATTLGPLATLEELYIILSELMKGISIDMERLAGLGVSTPGPIDYTRGVILNPPNLAGWNNVPLRQMVMEKFQVPSRLERDANAAAFGESRRDRVGTDSLLFVFADVGIGSGLIVNGEIYRGAYGGAGEIGHIRVEHDGERCNCGRRGCLETVSSGVALQKIVGGELSNTDLSITELLNLSAVGNVAANNHLRMAGQELGFVIANVCNMFNPGAVILGGRLHIESAIYSENVEKTARENMISEYANQIRIMRARLGDYSSAIGAAAMAFGDFINAVE